MNAQTAVMMLQIDLYGSIEGAIEACERCLESEMDNAITGKRYDPVVASGTRGLINDLRRLSENTIPGEPLNARTIELAMGWIS